MPGKRIRYYKHTKTGELFDSVMEKINPKRIEEMEPYFPPKYLRYVKNGRIFGWTFVLGVRAQRTGDFESVDELPGEEEQMPGYPPADIPGGEQIGVPEPPTEPKPKRAYNRKNK